VSHRYFFPAGEGSGLGRFVDQRVRGVVWIKDAGYGLGAGKRGEGSSIRGEAVSLQLRRVRDLQKSDRRFQRKVSRIESSISKELK
jgi:hypothetical protein